MVKINIYVREEIFIARSPEIVWDYTQDFLKRLEWDKFLTEAIIVRQSPEKTVNIKGRGNFSATLVYKLYDRPYKTTLVFADVKSLLISGGGGSWRYEKKNEGTLWTQQGTCILKNGLLSNLLSPFIRLTLRHNMRSAMKLAKKIIESKY